VNLALTRIIVGVLDKEVVRVVYSDESAVGGMSGLMLVSAILLNMDSQWMPVRDSIEAAVEETYGNVDRFVIKGKSIYHQIEHGEKKAKELMERLMAIPKQHLVPIWYGAVDRDGFKYQMENIHIDSTFRERDRPFMFALEACMSSVDTWVHSTLPEHQVIWIHDEGSLNERARETLRGFRWLRKESDWAQFEPEVIMPEAHVSHIADMIYFGDDKASRLLQLADACANTIVRSLRNDPIATPYYAVLQSQVQNHGARPWYENARKTVAPLRAYIAERRAARAKQK
jgi:hypothetical protein